MLLRYDAIIAAITIAASCHAAADAAAAAAMPPGGVICRIFTL